MVHLSSLAGCEANEELSSWCQQNSTRSRGLRSSPAAHHPLAARNGVVQGHETRQALRFCSLADALKWRYDWTPEGRNIRQKVDATGAFQALASSYKRRHVSEAVMYMYLPDGHYMSTASQVPSRQGSHAAKTPT